MTQVFLSTGSNIGNRRENLYVAAFKISEICPITAYSSVYETAAWGNQNQQSFLNQVLEIETTHSPEDLLALMLEIESQLGRKRIEKWGPRSIDIDILFFGNIVFSNTGLKIPHPEIQNRLFVLKPLSEIAPKLVHPVLHKKIEELLEHCTDKLPVIIFPDND